MPEADRAERNRRQQLQFRLSSEMLSEQLGVVEVSRDRFTKGPFGGGISLSFIVRKRRVSSTDFSKSAKVGFDLRAMVRVTPRRDNVKRLRRSPPRGRGP